MGDAEKIPATPFSGGFSSLIAAAHELKSPLSLVRQLSLSLDDDNISEIDRKKIIQQITLTSEKAIRLTSDLTKTSRLKDAMFELEPINPYQVCRDVVSELKPFIEAHGRSLKLVSCNRSILTIANRDLLRRVIMNFSDNALNYTDKKSTIEIKIGTMNFGKITRLGVRDYGPALPKNVSRMIKNKKLVAPTSMHRRPQSSGLGLYIVSQFAESMNGSIGVTRHRDGVTFYIDLQSSNQLSLL